ncbi:MULTISPECIES: sulfotransferase domain-containing protein [unclassified Coleofasciculus]|uniref:sulfotransferase domain-containing protein n=1 Tax=unclassified Coleofasciculus TaxID=2692782 RepID=UPI001881869F|nr:MULTISPECIES: sulfotransferase domain-containing protein [unclassified Coleofasciculus]MBE9126889.1 sulfotransferase domain-containing protein [Coleofasciculus sp. LEGE 07081]MBE9150215.1 sulfotransferase domain-containing protein [Coleofasciculus sp. LEGE 07092]
MILYKLKNKIKNRTDSNKLRRKVIDAFSNLNKPRSVIFYTTHKCASIFVKRLFDLIWKNSKYEFVDYGGTIFGAGDKLNVGSPYEVFLEQAYSELYSLHGKVYGPQRRYLDFPGRNNFNHIFFLRDPRDVLVSSYFSSFTHAEPFNSIERDVFTLHRKNVKEKGIDTYVLDEAEEWILPLYKQYKELRETSKSYIYLKYDLFSENTPEFIKKISEFLDLHPSSKSIDLLTREASPVQNVEVLKHKRSGKSGQYLEKLHPNTVKKLNHILSEALSEWEFI